MNAIFELGQVVTHVPTGRIWIVGRKHWLEEEKVFLITVVMPEGTTPRTDWDLRPVSELEKKTITYEQIQEVVSMTPYFEGSAESRRDFIESFMRVNRPKNIKDVILSSHEAVCASKEMGENEAFGHHPAVYYSLAMCGECGELANNVVKAMRDGPEKMEKMKEAISSELQDVIIYAYILAETNGINIDEIVKEKVDVVISRAKNGYYGKPLERKDSK